MLTERVEEADYGEVKEGAMLLQQNSSHPHTAQTGTSDLQNNKE